MRVTQNQMGSIREGSNPADCEQNTCLPKTMLTRCMVNQHQIRINLLT